MSEELTNGSTMSHPQGRPAVPNRYGVIRFTIGLQPDIYQWVVDLAQEEERTVQAQIAYILKQEKNRSLPAPPNTMMGGS